MISRRTIIKSVIPMGVLQGCGANSDSEIIDKLTGSRFLNVIIDSIVIIDKIITISSKYLTIKPGGGFLIINGSLTITDSSVDIYFASGNNFLPNSAFKINSGKFEARNSKFNAYSHEGIVDGNYFDDPAPNLIISGINNIEGYEFYREVVLNSNEFICHVKRFIGLVSISNHMEAAETFDNRRFCNFEAENNTFTGFHGVVGVGGLIFANVIGNNAYKNTFIQFVFNGDKIRFHNNKILFPGNGQTGDGLNVVGKINDCSIVDNDIKNGSCYGVAIYADEIKKLIFKGNLIDSGITHALLLMHRGQRNNWLHVDVSENILINNVGGIAVSGVDCSNVRIVNNYFQNNLKNWPSPVLSYNSSIGFFGGNLVFDNISQLIERDNLEVLKSAGLQCPPICITGIR